MLLLTILFGRVYCACICPLGILQEILPALVAGKTGRKSQYAYPQPYPVIRYGMFVLTIFTALLGTFAALNLVDPYSFFGRIVVHLFKPLLVAANNLAATLLESFEVYLLPTLSSPPVAYPVLLSTLILFYILTRMALYRGRLFCN